MSCKNTFLKSLILFVIFGATGLFALGAEKMEVLRPFDKSVIEKNSVTVIVKIKDPSIDKLKIVTEGDVLQIAVKGAKKIYCKTVMLEYGVNTLIVRAYADGKKVAQKMMEVFYKFPAYRGYKYPPSDFKKNFFHTTKNERECSRCHKMTSNEKEGMAFENPKDSNCYNCHKALFLGKKYAHAPSVNWVCGACHKSGTSANTKYPAPKELNRSCFKCHKKFKRKFFSNKYKHEPVAVGRCSRCHDSHATPQKYFVRLKVRELCTTCHGDKVAGSKKTGSDCKAFDAESCTDCHNPHSSDEKFMYEPGRHEIKEEKKSKGLWLDE